MPIGILDSDTIPTNANIILPNATLYHFGVLTSNVHYDERTTPPELRTAHQANDKAVMQAYGFWGNIKTEPDCVAELMRMYQEKTKK